MPRDAFAGEPPRGFSRLPADAKTEFRTAIRLVRNTALPSNAIPMPTATTDW